MKNWFRNFFGEKPEPSAAEKLNLWVKAINQKWHLRLRDLMDLPADDTIDSIDTDFEVLFEMWRDHNSQVFMTDAEIIVFRNNER